MENQSENREETCNIDLSNPSANAGEYWRWCPRCSRELQNRKCKLICTHCHYFMSCSDFD